MKTRLTTQPTKMNVFMTAGLIGAVLSLIVPLILNVAVLPSNLHLMDTILSVSAALSYGAAISVGVLVFGIYRRYFVKE